MRVSFKSSSLALALASATLVPVAAQAQVSGIDQAGTLLRGGGGSSLGGLQQGLGSGVPGYQERSGGGLMSSVFGCQASGSSQIIGALGGGVVGGLVGHKVGGTLGTIGIGALGAAAGSWIGCKLQRNAQMRAERAAQNAAATGQGQRWSDPSSGASGETTVVSGRGGQSLAGMRLADGVTPLSDYQAGSGVTTVAKNANLRSAPSASSALLGKLQAGETVTVAAATRDSQWSLVSQGGVGRGYVSSALLAPASSSAMASGNGCKVVKQTIQTGGQSESEFLNACPDRNGGWSFSKA